MKSKTTKAAGKASLQPLVRRRTYRGWIDPTRELPDKVRERTEIVFGSTKWNKNNVRCRITIEYAANAAREPRGGAA